MYLYLIKYIKIKFNAKLDEVIKRIESWIWEAGEYI